MFAFGAVLYEMLSGQRAFRGETAADTMTAILTREPADLDLAKLAIPAGLDRIVRRCLEKSADLRFQSATDLAFALENLTAASGATSGSTIGTATVPSPSADARRTRTSVLPWVLAGLAAVAAVVGWWPRGSTSTIAPVFDTFTRITELAGEETTPSLSSDGTTVAYAVRINDSWDIYTQRVGGRNATPILSDPQRNESGPAFSPDGASIAFHESDTNGGIFVAGATGESVRRVTEMGFHPAWSPDGKRIAFTTEEILNPSGRQGESLLYVVDAAGGPPRKVADGDAAQPSWSPSGNRIVYWSNTGGQRDLFTVAEAGGERVVLTNDSAIDWSPVWAPDGHDVYFSSDRGGAMNLWRVPIDPATGKSTGAPEPVTMGAQATSGLPSFSKDGKRLAFRSRVGSTNPFEIPIDPVTLKAGEPRLLDSRTNVRIPSDVSPDGLLVAFFAIGERQEDLFVGPPGGPMRRVIDDAPRDRSPFFTPDGKSLLFYSNRGGDWQAWMIGLDGGGLHQVGKVPHGVVYPMMSPHGDRIAFSGGVRGGAFQMALPGGELSPLPGTPIDGEVFLPTSWSRDAARLAGVLSGPSGAPTGVAVYDFAAKTTTKVSADPSSAIRWMADGRRVIYFTNGGWQLVVLDTVTRTRTVVSQRLPAHSTNDMFAISPDNRHVYYGGARAEADIWILERK